MTRPKKRTVVVEPAKTSSFLEALKFVSMITKDVGPINETHVYLGANWACAFNGTIAAGHKIQEDIYACPQSKLIVQALSRCGENISFTQLDNKRLSIKSDKFKAVVPCIDPILLSLAVPDPPIANIDDRFKVAIDAVGVLASHDAQRVVLGSILMNGQSVLSTNGKVIFEYWHGINLPPNLVLPKLLVEPLTNTSKKLVKFGFSKTTVTFYFEDDSWIRSQLYVEPWPDVSEVLDRPSNAWPIPAGFWAGLEAVAPFSETGFVYFDSGVLRSHESDAVGASYEIAGLPKGPCYPAKQLALIKPHATRIDFVSHGMLTFFGDAIRGCIAGIG